MWEAIGHPDHTGGEAEVWLHMLQGIVARRLHQLGKGCSAIVGTIDLNVDGGAACRRLAAQSPYSMADLVGSSFWKDEAM